MRIARRDRSDQPADRRGTREFSFPIRRVGVATDRSETARYAERWAADLAAGSDAELVLFRVLEPRSAPESEAPGGTEATAAASELRSAAEELAGSRASARILVDEDAPTALARAAEDLNVDVLVVGNRGMAGRREFLLGNIPNRISHCARCTVVIVNTDGQPGKRGTRRSETVSTAGATADEQPMLTGRAAHIGRVLARHGVKYLFARDGDRYQDDQAQGLRAALEELGPTFCKLGQILSTRPDLLPPAYIEALATLQDHVPPLPEEEVVKVMEQELTVPWEDVFESIDPVPMAAGTIAQVHRAKLTGGERVVVKVQRPEAREQITRDLEMLTLLATKTMRRPALKRVVDMEAVVEHLSSSLQRELDFSREAANVERMAGVIDRYPRLGVPRVYGQLSTGRLLVLEEVQGTPIREAPEGPARKEAARQLLEAYYRQILVDGFFHADPHPGNLLWWNERVYFIDFGMVGEIEPPMRRLLMLLLLAFWREDPHFLTDLTVMIAGEDENAEVDLPSFQEDMTQLMARYRHLPLGQIQLGPILQEMTGIAVRQRVPLPAALTLTVKALAQVQLATAELDPELDPFALAGRFVARHLLDRLGHAADPGALLYSSQKFGLRLARLVEALERLTGARPGPGPQVQFRGIEGLEHQVHKAGRRLSLSFAAAGSLMASAIAAGSSTLPGWTPEAMAAAGAVFTGTLVADLVRHR